MTGGPDASYPLPPVPSSRQLFFGAPAVGTRWAAGVRAGVAFGLPGAIAMAAGYPREALLVFLGSFAVLYGENRAYRVRAQVVLSAGAALLGSAALGAVLGHAVADGDLAPRIVEVAVLTAVSVVGVFVVDAARLGPPGSFFFSLVCGIGLLIARSGVPTGVIAGCAAIGIASSVVVSMVGALRDPTGPERAAVAAAVRAVDRYEDLREAGRPNADARHAAGASIWNGWTALYDAGLPGRADENGLAATLLAAHRRLAGVAKRYPAALTDAPEVHPHEQLPLSRPSLTFRLRRSLALSSHASATAIRVCVACLLAGALCLIAGLDRPDWAIIAAVLVLHQGLDRVYGTVRGLHRFAGTVSGLAFFGVLHLLAPTGLILVAILVALLFLIELFIASNYAVAVSFITPVALLVGGAGAHGDTVVQVRDRFVETTLGVAVALFVLWVVLPHAHRRTFVWTGQRVVSAGLQLLDATRTGSDREVLILRRDLQFELIGCAKAGVDAAHNDRDWTARHWVAHASIEQVAYDLLAAFWAASSGRVEDIGEWDASLRKVGGS